MKQARRRNDHGFTLTEMLVTVAIVIVLFALAMIPISKMRREVRQTELDSRAEIVFMAAQNQLTQLQAAGRASAYQGGVALGYVPADAEDGKYTDDDNPLVYVTNVGENVAGSAAQNILPEDKVDAEIWGANWIIEYDASSASVYAVFYSEQDGVLSSDTSDAVDTLRSRSVRLQQGAKVGYYGGDSVLSYDTSALNAKAEIVNDEQLLLKVTCNRVIAQDGSTPRPTITVTLKDESGHTAEVKIPSTEIDTELYTYTGTLMLDDLTEGEHMRFAEQKCFEDLVPGEDLTISVRVEVEDDLIEPSEVKIGEKVNSLFAGVRSDGGNRTAVIKYGRHLQNLDEDSGVNRQAVESRVITAAVQEQDIEFKSIAERGWQTLYGEDMTFKPIQNSKLTSYDSTYSSAADTADTAKYHPVIYDLTVDAKGDAGLFASFGKSSTENELLNIRLAGAKISGTDNVGGLVGKLSGETTIDGCQVYLSRARNHPDGKDETELWLDGSVTGGLIGNASGDVTIKDSFAATVLNGTEAAGGLIGKSGNVTVEHSYADCYVYAVTTKDGKATNAATQNGVAGGLIGSRNATNIVKITDCYAAGFLKAETTAGIAAGEIAGKDNVFTNVYTACASLDGTSLSYIIGKIGGVDEPSIENVYYLSDIANSSESSDTAAADTDPGSKIKYVSYESWSGNNRKDVAENKLAKEGELSAFVAEAKNTYAYNLIEGLGLTQYSYPALNGLDHYGDWQAKFENESLAYYEKYGENSYGFSGGNISTLKTDGTVAVGDGYGLLYATAPAGNVTVSVGNNSYTLNAKDVITITTTVKNETKSYYLLPLPAELVQKMDVGDSFYTKLTVGGTEGKTFYYNPHFASTATSGSDDKAPDAPDRVEVRTARQLNALSKYYSEYFKKDETGTEKSLFNGNTSFVQGTNIDYTSYDWANFGADGKEVDGQAPIGADMAKPFRYSYNGNSYEITGISFVGETCTGLFGYNTGALSNIIITTNEPMTNENGSANTKVPTSKVNATVQLNTVYVGVLAAWNQTGGTISNCAVSGYDLTGYAYSGSTSYVGGLVGFNAGTIRASSAVTPLIKGTGNLVQSLSIGGLVGGNGGQIRQSYAMAAISVMEVSGRVSIAGFAGENVGTIRSSYCATALLSAGADTYGFAPGSGSLNGCYFLNGGTYTFAGKVYLYDYDTTAGAAGVTGAELKDLSLDGFGTIADAAHSINHPNTVTDGADGEVCPYPGSVSGRNGLTHYGDWVTEADLGTLGMIYWEKEEGGSNDGYHFSFIGFENGVDRKQDSNLCEAHDDGGKITAYGYGYYWKDTEKEPELKAELAPLENVSDNGTFALGTPSTGDIKDSAAAELEQQVPGYKFVTYQTGAETDKMHLLSSKTANGAWTLTQTDKSGTAFTFKFIVNPFFADSYDYVSTKDTSENKTPGSDALPYQVRSVEQLQFINWSYDGTSETGSVTRDVTSGNYRTYPYLLYATVTGTGNQSQSDALNGDGIGGTRTIQTWKQTHDVNGTSLSAKSDGTQNDKLQPIAGAVQFSDAQNKPDSWGSGGDSYNMTMYNWFGGKYDGQSYYIKNIQINSYNYNVGVFGSTAGATIQNIVLYSDNDSVIQRKTNPTSYPYDESKPDEYQTFYALGGLVGIAYDYGAGDTSRKTANSTISNCAIAGYVIQDNSQNKLRLGESVVGGLIGVSSADLKDCSAVVDIKINCTHRWGEVKGTQSFTKGDLNTALYGNFVRVGGLVGGLQYKAVNCYTGGSITVSEETLKEQVTGGNLSDFQDGSGSDYVQVVRSDASAGHTKPVTFIYVAGVGGSGFAANFRNFTGKWGVFDGNPKFYNCYTYLNLPDMKGTITGIALIGSSADRFNNIAQTTGVTIENCYYLDSVKNNIKFDKASKCYFNTKEGSLYYIFNESNDKETYINGMLNGDVYYLNSHIQGGARAITRDGLTPLTYEQMSGNGMITKQNSVDTTQYANVLAALNTARNTNNPQGDYGWVSTEENNATIHGKYSFPGSDSELQGQDYPFPTVLTQTDLFGNTVHLHYGRWPKVGMFWKEGIASLDLIADYDASAKKSQIETQLVLNNLGDLKLEETDIPNVTFDYGGGAAESDIAKASIVSVVQGGNGTTPAFNVVLEGLSPGAVEITATFTKDNTTYTARMTLTVTAELNVVLDPAIVDEYVGESKNVALKALNCKEEEIEQVTWTYVNDDGEIAKVTRDGATLTVEGLNEGETTVHVTATVKLGDKTYTGTNVLSVTASEPGVLGIANTAAPLYCEGKLKKDLNGWNTENTTGEAVENNDYADSDAPKCDGSTLFLYGRGQKAKLSSFDVTSITVTGLFPSATDDDGYSTTKEVLNGKNQEAYTVTVGSLSASGKDTFLPLSVRGWKEGTITLTVTLTDRRAEANGAEYELSIPYTLTAADTQVTARFEGLNSEEISGSTVDYGETATAPTISDELMEKLKEALPENCSFADLTKAEGWEPSLTNPLYVDTVFKPRYEKSAYKVTFVNMGAEVSEATVEKGESVSSASGWPTAPTRDGYKFLGWTTDGSTYYTGNATGDFTPTEDVTLSAGWRKAVTIDVGYNSYSWVSMYKTEGFVDYNAGDVTLSFKYNGWVSTRSIITKIGDSQVTCGVERVWDSWNGYNDFYTYTVTIPRSAFPSDEWN